MKRKQPHQGFELVSQIPFPIMITLCLPRLKSAALRFKIDLVSHPAPGGIIE